MPTEVPGEARREILKQYVIVGAANQVEESLGQRELVEATFRPKRLNSTTVRQLAFSMGCAAGKSFTCCNLQLSRPEQQPTQTRVLA